MSHKRCPNCGFDLVVQVPPQPPIGTTVRDKTGALITRAKDGHWGESGMVPLASWEPLYRKWGPLVIVEEKS
jgi:hypothetical protein